MRYLFFLGSQSRLSRAELLTLLPQYDTVTMVQEYSDSSLMIVEAPSDAIVLRLFNRLGGSIKVAKVVLENLNPDSMLPQMLTLLTSPELEGKKDLAWQTLKVAPTSLEWPSPKQLRKYLQDNNHKIRIVGKFGGNKISSATIYHLLPKPQGASFNLVITGSSAIVAQDIAVQDIQTWRRFDLERPYRDLSDVGMLPPKLARMMVNLTKIPVDGAIWDPFCGTGTILLQALMMGYSAFGSDINKENVRGAQENIEWLSNLGVPVPGHWRTFKFDITRDPYHQEILRGVGKNEKFSAIVSEPYLGPISHQGKIAQASWRQVSQIYETLFQHAYKMLVDGGRMVLVKPVFRMVNKVSRRQNEVLWYNPKVSFNKGRWRLLGQEYADLWWRDNVHAVRRLVMVWEKIK